MSEDTERIKRLEDRCTALEGVVQVLVDVISNPDMWGESEGGRLAPQQYRPVLVRLKALRDMTATLVKSPGPTRRPAYRGLFVRLHNLLDRRSA
jgi:hypothetical protein